MESSEDPNTGSEPHQRLQLPMKCDREELGLLFTSNMPQLYRLTLRILRAPQDAEETLQDGFLSAIRHLKEFEFRARFSTWLTRIVINAAVIRFRESRRETFTSIDQNLDQGEGSLADVPRDPRPNPEETYAREERLRLFDRRIRDLPARYRSVLWRRDVQGRSTREAAEILGIQTKTVKSQLHRARKRLEQECRAAGTRGADNRRVACIAF
jgi:RNA polymerase sigma-70 factor, ECF subfamily